MPTCCWKRVHLLAMMQTLKAFCYVKIAPQHVFSFDYVYKDCVALEELYLSHNGISKMEGLSSLVNLRVLDVSSNKLTSVNDIPNLTRYV
jgi:Leucine-rich repeat (LRR) protein